MEKSKRVSLGIQKKKKPIKRNKKRFLNKVIDYLKSDFYMFAPLISPPPSDFGAPKISSSSATGVDMKEPSEGNNKSLLKKVEDYLMSDSYMYAPLVVPQPITSPAGGPSWYVKRVTTEVSVRTLTMRRNPTTVPSPNVIAEDNPSKGNLSETSISGQKTFGHKEMVKHMVYQNCRSSSVSDNLDGNYDDLELLLRPSHLIRKGACMHLFTADKNGKEMLNSQLRKVVVD